MTLVIKIPTLNDKKDDFIKLFAIYDSIRNCQEDVCFKFSRCRFLRPNAVAFLGGLARTIEADSRTVTFDWDSLTSNAVKANLCQNGFARMFGFHIQEGKGHSIPYREDTEENMNSIMDYLTDYWLGRGWVHVTDNVQNAIVGRMWEIYINAFEHSNSAIGVFSCGQHFKNDNALLLSVVDFGLGIPANIRKFISQHDDRASELSSDDCLRWAFRRGSTTKKELGGLGLDLLKDFVQVNQGKLEIYSNDGYAIIDHNGERYSNILSSFEGTIVHITLQCDENLYRFADEESLAHQQGE